MSKQLILSQLINCPTCLGTGIKPDSERFSCCDTCDGTGSICEKCGNKTIKDNVYVCRNCVAPITSDECLAELVKLDPSRSYNVNTSLWYHGWASENIKYPPTEYSISVIHGWKKPNQCRIFKSTSFEECLAQVKLAFIDNEPTPQQEIYDFTV